MRINSPANATGQPGYGPGSALQGQGGLRDIADPGDCGGCGGCSGCSGGSSAQCRGGSCRDSSGGSRARAAMHLLQCYFLAAPAAGLAQQPPCGSCSAMSAGHCGGSSGASSGASSGHCAFLRLLSLRALNKPPGSASAAFNLRRLLRSKILQEPPQEPRNPWQGIGHLEVLLDRNVNWCDLRW